MPDKGVEVQVLSPTPPGGLGLTPSCVEYPPFATIEGGEHHDRLPSLRAVTASHNKASGNSFQAFYNRCAKGDRFGVIPVHNASRLPLPPMADFAVANVPTFWVGCD